VAWPTVAAAADPIEVVDPGQGLVEIELGETGVTELSGIAFAGGDRYYAVSDTGGWLVPLRIAVDPDSGFVTAAAAEPPRKLERSYDLEGVATDGDTVWVCDELSSTIRQHRAADGAELARLRLPAVFARVRRNLGIESLAHRGAFLWTANEEALRSDGDTASESAGTRVRIQRLDTTGKPGGQWAYATDPVGAGPLFGRAHSGVADLVALSDHALLVLERSFGSRGFRARLYRVDVAGAMQTGDRAQLAEDDVEPLRKQRLWELGSFTANLEGATLGPPLRSGGVSLLLVSDDGGAGRSFLYPLILR